MRSITIGLAFLIALMAAVPGVAGAQIDQSCDLFGGDSDGDEVCDIHDLCPYFANASASDVDGNGIGDVCECGDQTGDGRVNVGDLIAINRAIFDPTIVSELCDTNDDQRCDVRDLVGANARIFGRPAYCSRFPSPDRTGVIPGRFIVVFRTTDEESTDTTAPPDPDQLTTELLAPYGVQARRTFRTALRGFSAELSRAAAAAIAQHPEVLSVELVLRGHLTGVQTSPPWALDRIDERVLTLDGIFSYPGTARDVHAYIIDSGIRATHDEFEGRVSNEVDYLGTGWHCSAHGTHVASLVGGKTYGVAKKVKLHNLRIANCADAFGSDDAVAAFDWVAEHHVSPALANLSGGFTRGSSAVDTATKGLLGVGVTVVVSAGNENQDACNVSPARVGRAITVGASSVSDSRWTFIDSAGLLKGSNWGSCVDLFAPGSTIIGASNTSDTATVIMSGTSMAAPLVTGVAALYLSHHPHALPPEVHAQIVGHATSGALFSVGTGSPNLLLYGKSGEALGNSVASGDIDRDGRDDLVVGAPGADDGSVLDAGEIQVFLGSSTGFTTGSYASASALIAQDTAGVPGSSEDGDAFGTAVAIGDFNGDGYDDVAASMPGDSINTGAEAGAVDVFYGSSSGLSLSGVDRMHQDQTAILDQAEDGDGFGAALAVGDFDGDQYDDLAVGVPGEDVDGAENAGGVAVIHGSASGMDTSRNQFWAQDNPAISGSPESGDLFGAALSAGDFDGDGRDDLVIGVPGESVDSAENAGMVVVLYGTSTGLLTSGSQGWHQDSPGISGGTGAGDFLGAALAAGDFDGDGRDDLAIGDPGEDLDPSHWNAGMVIALYGSSSGLSSSGSRLWNQDSPGISGDPEDDDLFGVSLAAADLDGDGREDLIIGSAGEAISSTTYAGMVSVIYGASSGLTSSGQQAWHQDTPSVLAESEESDRFGAAVAAGDFDGDGYVDMAVGVPGEDEPWNRDDDGACQVFYSGYGGVSDEDEILR